MTTHLRSALPQDIAALAQLIGELGYPTSTEEMARRMAAIADRADIATFVAEIDGVVGGMITLSVSPSLYRSDLLGAITVLVVSPAFRGRSIAPLLVEHGEAWLRAQGAGRAAVHPSTSRADAHRLYERLGYENTGSRLTKSLT
jgi:GNAT superfamily N-acetyltransferase